MTQDDVKHTPGPWEVEVGSAMLADNGVASLGRLRVVAVTPVLYENAQADAHLIAAAPELLAACRAMVSWNDFAADEDSGLESLYEEAIRRARAAIAKAEGSEG